MEEYIDLLYEMQDSFLKKAFFKGCNLACSFLGETSGKYKKGKEQSNGKIPFDCSFCFKYLIDETIKAK